MYMYMYVYAHGRVHTYASVSILVFSSTVCVSRKSMLCVHQKDICTGLGRVVFAKQQLVSFIVWPVGLHIYSVVVQTLFSFSPHTHTHCINRVFNLWVKPGHHLQIFLFFPANFSIFQVTSTPLLPILVAPLPVERGILSSSEDGLTYLDPFLGRQVGSLFITDYKMYFKVSYALRNQTFNCSNYHVPSNTVLLIWSSQSVVTSSCLLYTSPSPRDATLSRMPSSA